MKFSNNYFSIDVRFRKNSVVMSMKVVEDFYHTRLFKNVVSFLQKNVPDVLETKCYNPDHLPFCEEVKSTEFGHLFEHMLISQLCEEVISAGGKDARYRANTSWNWKKNPFGTFEITINSKVDEQLFSTALHKTAAYATVMCHDCANHQH